MAITRRSGRRIRARRSYRSNGCCNWRCQLAGPPGISILGLSTGGQSVNIFGVEDSHAYASSESDQTAAAQYASWFKRALQLTSPEPNSGGDERMNHPGYYPIPTTGA